MNKKYQELINSQNEGMRYALKIVKEKGIEGLEEEIKFRSKAPIPVEIKRKAYYEHLQDVKNYIYNATVDTVMTLAHATLNREFDFGQKRLQRFQDRFDFLCECVKDPDNVKLQEIAENLEEETKFKIVFRNDFKELENGIKN